MRRRFVIALVALAAVVSVWAGDVPARHVATPAERTVVTPVLMQARQALFEKSDLDFARTLAQQQLKQRPGDVEALFIEMEAAALQADSEAELDAALKLCEMRVVERDPRADIAAARIVDLAANTADFRAAVPRIEAMLVRRSPYAGYLRSALLAAAADGAPGINTQKEIREAGRMTDWRIAGPFGGYGNLEFDEHWAPERDALAQSSSDGHAVERFRFDDGMVALPGYFGRNGVFYAASEIAVGPGPRTLRVESAGTLEIMVDGGVVLRKDSRFRMTPEVAWRIVRLRPGRHRVVVKFLASASPFRLALMPGPVAPERRTSIDYAPEAAYIAAAQKYWAGDYNGVIRDGDGARNNASALMDFLVYRAWTHVADDSPETTALLKAALRATPSALAAEYELALRAYNADRVDDALARLQRVLAARENFAAAQELMADIAISLNWPVPAENALEVPLRVHPSCDVLLKAYKFLLWHARYEHAHQLQAQLADCAPDTLAYVRSLSDGGEHEKAAEAAREVVARRPLDRSARELLVRELALAGKAPEAHAAAEELAMLAPNSARYRRMAQLAPGDMDALLDGPQASRFGQAFYAKYRRDGIEMVRKTEDRKFSGGPAVLLVNDRVARLWDDGQVSLYVHKLTRVLDRDGIEKYGEADIPHGAQLLELRTLKPDGSVAEPEFTPEKATVSMPGLAAGDAIDEEYVIHYGGAGGIAAHGGVFQQTFGSFAAPILYSRFVAITPAADMNLRTDTTAGIVPPRSEVAGNTRVIAWEKNDIPQSVEEVATARGDVLPVARLVPELPGGWNDIRDRFRDELVDAMRIGPRVERVAARLRSRDAEARAREIFRLVADSVRSAGPFNPDDLTPAEDALGAGAGSRTITVLALARAAGLDADLVLARSAGAVVRDTRASLGLYTRPLIKFRFPDGHEAYADAETDGLAFGAIPPTIERQDALLVPVARENQATQIAGSAIVALPANAEEQSVAEGNVTLDKNGTLTADVTIRMGAWRGAQMRTILAGIEPAQRPDFFQQLAARIFPGAENVTGAANNERDPDRPLELTLHCRAPRYVDLAQSTADLDQLVPVLGLKKMYATGARRMFPLFIDTPLVESANFRVHLPPGIVVLGGAPGAHLSSAFGSYSLTVRQPSPSTVDVRRSFRIPVQMIAPDRFPQFSAFAARIDEAERQRITLEKN